MNSPFIPTDLAETRDNSLSDVLQLANPRLVLTDQVLSGRITVENGIISEISEGDEVPTGAVDCDGDFVMPGLVELHTDNLERHIEPRPEVDRSGPLGLSLRNHRARRQ